MSQTIGFSQDQDYKGEKIIYYFVREDGGDIEKDDYGKLISVLNAAEGVSVFEEDQYVLRIESGGIMGKTRLKPVIVEADEFSELGLPSSRIEVETERVAPSINMFKHYIEKLNWRIYSTKLKCYLPKSYELYDKYAGAAYADLAEIFKAHNLEELFQVSGTYIFYARNTSDDSIHIINHHLLYYLFKAKKVVKSEEFSYKVAENINEFVAKYDSLIVPFNFYSHYKRKSPKIVNSSHFDIEKITRKVFIKPYIFELNNKKNGFYLVGTEQGSQLYMDKIKKGENLDAALKRILKEEVEVAENYIGAHVHPNVEFDLDRNGKLAPRLVVSLYIHEGQMTENHRQKLERGWVSPKDLKQ